MDYEVKANTQTHSDTHIQWSDYNDPYFSSDLNLKDLPEIIYNTYFFFCSLSNSNWWLQKNYKKMYHIFWTISWCLEACSLHSVATFLWLKAGSGQCIQEHPRYYS